MFSTCSELTPRAPIPDGRMEPKMQPCVTYMSICDQNLRTWMRWCFPSLEQPVCSFHTLVANRVALVTATIWTTSVTLKEKTHTNGAGMIMTLVIIFNHVIWNLFWGSASFALHPAAAVTQPYLEKTNSKTMNNENCGIANGRLAC